MGGSFKELHSFSCFVNSNIVSFPYLFTETRRNRLDLLNRNISAQQALKWLLHRNGSVQRKGVKSMGNRRGLAPFREGGKPCTKFVEAANMDRPPKSGGGGERGQGGSHRKTYRPPSRPGGAARLHWHLSNNASPPLSNSGPTLLSLNSHFQGP